MAVNPNDPLVVRRMNLFKDLLLQRENAEMFDMTRRWKQVERSLQEDIEKLAEKFTQEGITPAQLQSVRFRQDRLTSLLNQIRREIVKYNTFAEEKIKNEKKAAAKIGIKAATSAINTIMGNPVTKVAFDILPFDAVEFLVAGTKATRPLGELLYQAYPTAADGIIKQLILSTAKGINPRETARLVIRDGLSQGLNRILTIARTEQMRTFRESNRRAYIHSGVVTAYYRSAARDERTCIGCLATDGWEVDINESFKSHPTCRCAMIPKVKGFAPPEWETGPDWFKRQPEVVQRKMLGPTRYDAYKTKYNGRLSRFVQTNHNPIWGDSYTTKTLAQLNLTRIRPGATPAPAPEPLRPLAEVNAELAAQKRNDNIKPVSAALDFNVSSYEDVYRYGEPGLEQENKSKYQRVVTAIDRVHDDGVLPSLPIVRVKGKPSDRYGSYAYRGDDQIPIEIKMYERPGNDPSEHREATLVHEIGHFIDHQAFTPGSFGSENSPEFENWRKAVDSTAAIKKLRDMKKYPKKYVETKGQETGHPYTISPSPEFVKYGATYREIWARSYAQYIGSKSGDPVIREQNAKIANEGGFYDYRQWQDDDFEIVEQAIDELFRGKGWLK